MGEFFAGRKTNKMSGLLSLEKYRRAMRDAWNELGDSQLPKRTFGQLYAARDKVFLWDGAVYRFSAPSARRACVSYLLCYRDDELNVHVGNLDINASLASNSAVLRRMVYEDQDRINREIIAKLERKLDYKRYAIRELKGDLEEIIHGEEWSCTHEGGCSPEFDCACTSYYDVYTSDAEEELARSMIAEGKPVDFKNL